MNRLMKMTPAPLALAVALALASAPLRAQTQGGQGGQGAPQQIRIAAQPLAEALNDWARQTRIQLVVQQSLVAGKTAPAISGSLTPRAALDRLLAGSGLVAAMEGNAAVVKTAPATPAASGTSTLPAVTVVADGEESATGRVQGYVAKRSATATKTDTPIIETPQSLTVITADRMEAMGATTLKDALSYTPGVAITTFGADSRYDWLTLRGFDAYAPGFYLDGLPLRNNGNWGVWRTENYGAERIELLRGPASVLYGQASPGGVVNVVSKRPTAEPLRELQVQLGDHNRKQVAGDFSGPLDADGKVLYRVVGLLRDAELPAENMPDRRFYLAPSLTWRISGDTRLTLLAQVDRTRAGVYNRIRPQVGSVFPTAIGTRIPASLLTGDPNYDRFHSDQWMVGYEFEHRLNNTVTLRQNARYGELKVDYAGVWPNRRLTTVDAKNPLNPANFMLLGRYPTGSREQVSSFSIDNQMQVDLRAGDWQHKLLIGLDYQRNRIDQYTFSTGTAPSINIYAPVYAGPIVEGAPYMNADTRLAQTGLYIQDQIKWGDRWSLTLGGRYDSASNDTFDRLQGKSTQISQHKFTSRAGLVYVMPNGWAPYLSYSESFAPTGLFDPVTRDPFKPETGRQYEAGIRYQPPEGKQSYSAAIFDLRRQNYITYGTGGAAPKQTGEISVRGLELEAMAELAPRLNVTASYDYTPRAMVTASANPGEIGKQANAVPRHRMSVWANYRFVNGVKVGLGARYTGTSHGDGEKIAPTKVPAATVFDAMIGYDLERWSLALNLRNIANKDFIANCDQYGKCYYGAPRSMVATATYRW
ncbi:iron complex outermembrane receptor protein [Variovorax boronicumulans]|uniref:TonB-dependent siderophore receptor n=1 Tax=Variovorax boronicumulans TaxID=436515 RepID=UPI00278062B5|nr:TonB-dependent siderophore receptor [Variovorax boronicumulans]MDP9991230.1 iron complex outermembrane receptor protein [Variovorax boronicumulans]MDQ0003406.1 iron complex outermembrane receptor protein [Variovorax boronicumulans]